MSLVDDHRPIVDHRISIGVSHVESRRHCIIANVAIRQHGADPDRTFIAIGRIAIGRNVFLDDIMVESRVLIGAEKAGDSAGDTTHDTTNYGPDRSGRCAAFSCALCSPSDNALRLCRGRHSKRRRDVRGDTGR